MRTKIVIVGIAIVGLCGCPVRYETASVPLPPVVDVTYVPIQPRNCSSITMRTPEGEKEIFFSELTNKQINNLLPLEQSVVTVNRIDVEGGLTFASAGLTGKAGRYRVFLDYLKFRDESFIDTETPCRVGVGIRIVADVATKKANLDLSSIFSLGIAAKMGYLQGRIEVLKIGIDSSKVSFLMPPPMDINDSTLQNALQAAAAIRAQVYESETTLSPHIVAMHKQVEPVQ